MTIGIGVGMIAICCAALLGQSFEVVSVKPSDPNGPGTVIQFPNGSAFQADGITARDCLAFAYEIQPFQVSGGASWIGSQRYDITAKMPADAAGAPRTPERIARMRVALQALLAERFQLVVHRETRTMPAYTLVAAKSGFKLKATTDDGHGSWSSGRGKLKAQRTSIDAFARYLSGILGNPVTDATAIKGVFDLTLEWVPDDVQSPGKAGGEAAEPSAGPSIFAALQEQLGLKLETKKTPVEMIVIDRIERPTAN
jgi:uncharacterized protein (TIGR03435 family)